MRGLYLLPVLGALAGGYELLRTLAWAQSAPQQAAGAAIAATYALLPYVFARAMVELAERPTTAQASAPTTPTRAIAPAVSPEEYARQASVRRRAFVLGMIILVVLSLIAGALIWMDTRSGPQPGGFYERYPGAP